MGPRERPESPGRDIETERTRDLAPFILTVGFFVAATAGSLTLLPLACQAIGIQLAVIGLIVALPGLAQILAVLPAGTMSDRFGRRRLMLLAMAALAVSDVLLVTGLPIALVLGAAGVGLAGALFFPAMLAYSTEISVVRQMWVQGFNGSVQGFGALAGAAAAGLAAGLGGFGYGFLASMVFAIGGLVAILRLSSIPERGRHAEATVSTLLHRSWAILRTRPLVGQAVLASLPQVVAIAVVGYTFFPLLLADRGIDVATIGALVGARSLMLACVGLALPIFVPRFGLTNVMLAPQLVGSIVLGVTPLLSGEVGFGAIAIVQGLAFGMVSGASNMMVANGTLPSERAAAIASQDLFFGVGTFVYPLALAAVGVLAGTEAIFVTASAICVVSLLTFARWSHLTQGTVQVGI